MGIQEHPPRKVRPGAAGSVTPHPVVSSSPSPSGGSGDPHPGPDPPPVCLGGPERVRPRREESTGGSPPPHCTATNVRTPRALWGWGHCTAMNVPGGGRTRTPTPTWPRGGWGSGPPPHSMSASSSSGGCTPHTRPVCPSIPQCPPVPEQLSPPCPQSRAWGPSLSPSSNIPTSGVPQPRVPGSGTRTPPIHHLPHPKRCTPKQGHPMGLGGRVSPGEHHPLSPCSLVPWGHWDAHSLGPICPLYSPGPLSLRITGMLFLLPPWSSWHFACPTCHPQDKGVARVTPVPTAPHHPTSPSISQHHGALRAHRSPTVTCSTAGTPHPQWGGSVPPLPLPWELQSQHSSPLWGT